MQCGNVTYRVAALAPRQHAQQASTNKRKINAKKRNNNKLNSNKCSDLIASRWSFNISLFSIATGGGGGGGGCRLSFWLLYFNCRNLFVCLNFYKKNRVEKWRNRMNEEANAYPLRLRCRFRYVCLIGFSGEVQRFRAALISLNQIALTKLANFSQNGGEMSHTECRERLRHKSLSHAHACV